ncbi:MAG: M48 family metalloprotease [Vicingaceae bacterium]
MLIITISFVLAENSNGQVKYTNQTVDLRKGPGAFYETIIRIFINNTIEVDSNSGYWEKIRFKELNGWVPSYTIGENQPNSEKSRQDSLKNRMSLMFAKLASSEEQNSSTSLSASPAQMAAAVKGFAEKFRAKKNIDYTVDFEEFVILPFTTREYESFKKDRGVELSIQNRVKLLYPNNMFVAYLDPNVDRIGYAVATAVAQEGLIKIEKLQNYLDMMLARIVEVSQRKELEMHAYILDTDDVVGYSLPGGFIFISRGAISAMQNESELAHFLGHEAAHLILGHAVLEYEERRTKIRAADAFDELGSEFEDSKEDFEDEMNDWADQIYDYVNKERLEEYETNADYWGLVYSYLIGLDPYQSHKYLQRIDISDTEARMEWNGLSLDNRLENIRNVLSELELESGRINNLIFNKMKKLVEDY